MSVRVVLIIDADAFWAASLRHKAEHLGVAMRLLCLMAQDQTAPDWPDVALARSLGYGSSRSWLSARASVLEAAASIVKISRLKVRRVPIPAWLREAVTQRDGKRCVYCGDVDGPFHIDHRVPVADGGLTIFENLYVACVRCNLRKGAQTWEIPS